MATERVGAPESSPLVAFLSQDHLTPYDRERLLLGEDEMTESLSAEEALSWMYERDFSQLSSESAAKIAFVAAGYVPKSEEEFQAFEAFWQAWVRSALGSRLSWTGEVKSYLSAGIRIMAGLEDGDQAMLDAGGEGDQVARDPVADGDTHMQDASAQNQRDKPTRTHATIPPHPSLSGASIGHKALVVDGVRKVVLDLSSSGASDPKCFQLIDTSDGGAALREMRQRWTKALNLTSKVKVTRLEAISAEGVAQYLKGVKLEASNLLENAELGIGIRDALDADGEMLAHVALRCMDTKLVTSIQIHLPKPVTWTDLERAVNTQVAAQRDITYYFHLLQKTREKTQFMGPGDKCADFIKVFQERFTTFSANLKFLDEAHEELASVFFAFFNAPYTMHGPLLKKSLERFPGRFMPPTMAAMSELLRDVNEELKQQALQADMARQRAGSTSRGASTPRGGSGGRKFGGRGQQPSKSTQGTQSGGRGRGDGQSGGHSGWRPNGGRGRGRGRDNAGRGWGDKKHSGDEKNNDPAKKQKK